MMIRGDRVALPDGIRPARVHVRDGRIAAVDVGSDLDARDDERRATGAPVTGDPGPVLDAGRLVVFPGLVDSHVHINEPGRAHWEGFHSATRAAAAGGVTTLVDMPLNSRPPTTTADGLRAKREAAHGACHVDVAFWGGLVPGNTAQLPALAAAGVRGFKCFLSPSGVEEFAHVSLDDLRAALPTVARLGLPLLVHAEWPAALKDPSGDPRRYQTWLDSRPAASEVAAIERLLDLAGTFGIRLHIVHLATPAALPLIATARASGVAVTVETCPHYLAFAAEDVADGATAYKCAPPIRGATDREALWDALATGAIDLVATDHSPAPPALKHTEDGDFVAAWGGIASLQLGLAAVWTGAAERAITMEHLPRWLSHAPAALAGLCPGKGAIVTGADADFVLWDPDASSVIDGASLYHRHPVTPYHGLRLRGRVHTTILRGAVVFEEGECRGPATGRLL